MKQLRESVRRLKRGRKEDIVLVRRWFPQFCFHNMRCVRKLAAYASDAKADVIRYSPVRDVCECHFAVLLLHFFASTSMQVNQKFESYSEDGFCLT